MFRQNRSPLLAASVLLTLCCTQSSVFAQQSLPFSAEMTGIFALSGAPPIVDINGMHTFQSVSPFPFVTWTWHDVADLSQSPIPLTDGTGFFADTNGDRLNTIFDGVVVSTSATTFDISGDVSFAGGTGRFFGATGNAAYAGTGDFNSATTGTTTLSWNGTLTVVPEPGGVGIGAAGIVSLLGIVIRRRKQR